MNSKRIWAAVALCVVVCYAVCWFTDVAEAKVRLSEKKGLSGLMKGKGVEEGDERLAKPYQKWIGIGSVVVMVIVIKYL